MKKLIFIFAIAAVSCTSPKTIYKVNFDNPVQLVELTDTTNTMMIESYAKIKVDPEGLYVIIATQFNRDTVHFAYSDKKTLYGEYARGNLTIRKTK